MRRPDAALVCFGDDLRSEPPGRTRHTFRICRIVYCVSQPCPSKSMSGHRRPRWSPSTISQVRKRHVTRDQSTGKCQRFCAGKPHGSRWHSGPTSPHEGPARNPLRYPAERKSNRDFQRLVVSHTTPRRFRACREGPNRWVSCIPPDVIGYRCFPGTSQRQPEPTCFHHHSRRS